jgi:hypothetical protein
LCVEWTLDARGRSTIRIDGSRLSRALVGQSAACSPS